MTTVANIIILLLFLLEVIILFKVERVLWKTYYTPLNFLMIPYTIVMLINVFLPASLDFIPFYFPSILVWAVGLLVFFIPSLLLSFVSQINQIAPEISVDDPKQFKAFYIIGFFLLIISLFHIYTKTGISEELIGSDEFADETLARGVWAHIREFLLAISIISVFYVNKKRLLLYVLIVGVILISVIYQVKGWIVIPVLTGLFMRLITQKTQLKLKHLFYIVLGGFAIFFLSYYLLLVFTVDDKELSDDVLSFIYNHFIFYLISGTSGLSGDMQYGILEQAHPEYIFAPFMNLFYMLDSTKPLVVPINSVFIDSGWLGTNVRTFFGTIYINLGTWGSILYIFFFSSFMYLMLLWVKTKANLFNLSIFVFYCTLLFLGWFDFYFASLAVLEIPFFFLILSGILYLDKIKKEDKVAVTKI